jgi:RES domain-containing protein
VRVVYVSEHQSTAALEVFANRMPFVIEENYKAFYLEWPDDLTEIFPAKKLPVNWRVHPPPVEIKEIGDRWVQERRSAVLALPSAISPAETNFLLNPEHRDFKRIRIVPPIDFDFDPRLIDR